MIRNSIFGFCFLLCIAFTLPGTVCYPQHSASNKTDLFYIQKLLEDIQTYGAFTADYNGFSDAFASKFKTLFDENAVLFNPFTAQNNSPEAFSSYCKKNFSNGIYLEFSAPANIYSFKNDTDSQILSFESDLQLIGNFRGKERKEISTPLIITIIIDKQNGTALIRSIQKKENRNFSRVEVQLINLKKPDKPLAGITLQLVLHDSVFQKSVSNQNGIATFVGVPFRDAYSLSLSNKQNILFKKPILYNSDTLSHNELKYFLPAIYNDGFKRYLSLGGFGAAQFVRYSDPAVTDSINYETLSGQGFQYSFNIGFIQNIIQFNSSDLLIETGLQFDYITYSINTSNLQHALLYEINPSDFQAIKFQASKLDFEADEINLKIPLYIVYKHKFNFKLPLIAEIGGGANLMIQVNKYYNQRTEYTISGQNNPVAVNTPAFDPYLSYTDTKKRYQAFSATRLQYTLFAGFKSYFPTSSIMYGFRLKYLADFENLRNPSNNSIFEDDLLNPTDITKIMQKKTSHAFGLELSVTIPLNF